MTRFRTIQPLNPAEWLLAPAALCVVVTLVLAVPIRLFGLRLPEPVFGMAPAFAWAIIRPSVLAPFVLIALGLFQDLIWGGPIGLWPLCLLALYGQAFSARQALTSEGFWALGAWYCGGCAVSFGVGVLLTTLVSGEVVNLAGVGLQFAATAALYPVVWTLTERFEDADVRFR